MGFSGTVTVYKKKPEGFSNVITIENISNLYTIVQNIVYSLCKDG